MGHIRKLPSGRWQVRHHGPDGRQRAKNFGRKVDADRWLIEAENRKAHGVWIDPELGRIRLDAWASGWITRLGPALRPKTGASYQSLLRSRIIPQFGSWSIGQIRPSDIQDWVAQMVVAGLSPSRIRQAHVVLSLALQSAVHDGLVARNAGEGVKLPRLERREAAYFDAATVERIARAAPVPYDLLIRILGVSGLRWGEAAGLRRGRVDLLRGRLRVEETLSEIVGRLTYGPTKSYAARSVPLPQSLVADLSRYLSETFGSASDPVFTSPTGGLLRHSNFYGRVWRPTLRRLGLPMVGLHVLRHSAAAELIAAGASPKALQTVLGHASAAFSLTVYAHLFDADLDALAQALDARRGQAERDSKGTPQESAAGECLPGEEGKDL